MPPANQPIRVLLVEDDPDDAHLVRGEIEEAVPDAEVTWVDRDSAFRKALRAGADVILADYSVPSFGALHVLETVRGMGMDTPVIVVSGAIGEDIAIEAMRLGASDYLLKDRMGRVGQAIRQAVQRTELQREKARVEAELARSERRLRTIIDSEPECVLVLAADGEILDINPAGVAMFEADAPDALVGSALSPLLYSEDRFAFWKWHKASLGGETGKLRFRIVGRRGGLRWMEGHSAPLRNEAGDVEAVLSVVRDVTENRATEERLRESDTIFRQLTENIREVFWLMDPARTRVLYISPAFETIWGRPASDMLANPQLWEEIVHQDDREAVAGAIARQSQEETHREYRILRPDGTVRRISERTFPVQDRAGRTYRIAGIAQDATR